MIPVFIQDNCEQFPSCEGGENAEGMGWLFFGDCILITFEDQRTTTRSLRSPPYFAGGQLL